MNFRVWTSSICSGDRRGKTLEFKRDLSSPQGPLRTIVAFANTSGGTLLVGVEVKTRYVRGVDDPLDVEEISEPLLDVTDRAILDAIGGADGRLTSEVAKAVGVTTRTARTRLDRSHVERTSANFWEVEVVDREHLAAASIGESMTIGELSERTGVSVKRLRRYEDLGFIYTVGRSAGNYRLFDESALWCVGLITTQRSLGLTLTEISDLVGHYLARPDDNIGPRLAERLRAVRDRTGERIDELQQLLDRIDTFEREHRAELHGEADFRKTDPRFRHAP